jgi:hypothetical protein
VPEPKDPIKIGNCSGFYGDRISAMREMLEGGPLDVLTGDYLAELTMLILGKDTLRNPDLGYAKTFLRQAEDCLALALEKGVRIVSNAGGLNPRGLAEALERLDTGARIAYVDGDDVRGKLEDFPDALTANAYLGGFGIARALEAGADVVVTGRVTDAAVVMGPAIWWHHWTPADLDALAGAVVAGHVIECGTQATGGNFAGLFDAIDAGLVADPTQPFGFPIAEIAADGTTVITKHPGTGGLVTVDTVTAQLFYEIQGSSYLNPDVTTDLTSAAPAGPGPGRDQRRPRHRAPGAAEGGGQPARRLAQPGGVRAHRPRPGPEGGAGAGPVRGGPAGRPAAVVVDLAGACPRLPDGGGRRGAAAADRLVHRRAGRRPGVHRPGDRAGARLLRRLPRHRAARQAERVRRLPADVRRPRAGRAHGPPARRQHGGDLR